MPQVMEGLGEGRHQELKQRVLLLGAVRRRCHQKGPRLRPKLPRQISATLGRPKAGQTVATLDRPKAGRDTTTPERPKYALAMRPRSQHTGSPPKVAHSESEASTKQRAPLAT